MTLNNFGQSDEELQNETKDSLIRIISYWKGRANVADANVKSLLDENDQLQNKIDLLEDELDSYVDDLYVERSDWDA